MVYRVGVFVACGLLQACMGTSVPTPFPPAKLPPVDFAGLQYVDNDGCAFVRAGSGDVVSWAPRLNPDRTQVCGLAPTFADMTTAESTVAEMQIEAVSADPQQSNASPSVFGDRTVPASNPDPATLEDEVIRLPAGYVRVWTDGRINPERGLRRITPEEALAMGIN